VEQWSSITEADYAQARSAGVPLVISIGYTAEHIRAIAPRVAPYADAVELSTRFLADEPHLIPQAVQAAKEVFSCPVWVKLAPLGHDVRAQAMAAAEAGADAIVAVDSFGPCLGIDAEQGAVLFPDTGGYAWLSGASIKNIALRAVWDVSRVVNIPVIGCGGIARGVDVVEFLMTGARAVQVATAAILQGPQVFGRIATELDAWLNSHGYTDVQDIVGLTHRRIAQRQVRTTHVPPVLNPDACIGCEICPTSCVYHALEMVGERKTPTYKVRVIGDRCWGCGICATRCPTRALGILGVSLVP
jgi:Pyruvate/2-oxoacid:ferredoxin oxidoreductase delta subunit